MRFDPVQTAMFCGDVVLTAASAYLAFCLRLAVCPLPPEYTALFLGSVAPWIALRLLGLLIFRMYRVALGHTSIRDLEAILLSTVLSSLLFAGFVSVCGPPSFPKSVLIIDWFIGTFFLAGLRIGYRIFVDLCRVRYQLQPRARLRRVLIVGAGVRGALLGREVRRRPIRDVALVGFLDDDPAKRHLLLHGAPVLGTTQELRRVVAQYCVEEVIVAMPSATGDRMREIIAQCEDLPVRLRILPEFSDLDDAREGWRSLRDVSLEDLLRREPVRVNMGEIAGYLAGERVLITGAGGSIGSELARQIARIGPRELLLLGHGENSIYEIEQELRRSHSANPTALIADIRDAERVRLLFERHRPTVVFHAAAHKHVPLMEASVTEAVTNNVLGTRNLARIASWTGVKRFVMISTDKAVNPTSVMGASKRVAERVIQTESGRSDTEFAVVRFGNVLGSRGSVVPLMRKQIEQGGPVTVTHPSVTRYFMTIPEAVQLVIQAGALGGRGTIYVLDMGEPVRILDLARDLIRLSGLVPGKDIAIEYTGLRPGEKLFEELLSVQEGVSVTRHEQIFAAAPAEFSASRVDFAVEELVAAAQTGLTDETRRLLQHLVPSFTGWPVSETLPWPAVGPEAEQEVEESLRDAAPMLGYWVAG